MNSANYTSGNTKLGKYTAKMAVLNQPATGLLARVDAQSRVETTSLVLLTCCFYPSAKFNTRVACSSRPNTRGWKLF